MDEKQEVMENKTRFLNSKQKSNPRSPYLIRRLQGFGSGVGGLILTGHNDVVDIIQADSCLVVGLLRRA